MLAPSVGFGAARRSALASPTILLVEDDDTLRRLMYLVLRSQGFEVLTAAHGREAQAICKESNRPIHLLVTDLQLPEMDGQDLAARVAAERPGVKILFISGRIEEVTINDPTIGYLPKPFTPSVLIESVERMLGRS